MIERRQDGPARRAHGGQLSDQDYARAEHFLPWNAERLVFDLSIEPHWLDDGQRFWYRHQTRRGSEFIVVDPQQSQQAPAFDHVRLAAVLSRASGIPTTAEQLPFDQIEFTGDDEIRFQAYGENWLCDLETYDCRTTGAVAEGDDTEGNCSPDGKWVAFAADHNLHLRANETGAVSALTEDGVADNDYATPLPSPLKAAGIKGRGQPAPLAALWSPDSGKCLSYRIDSRGAGLFHLVQSTPLDGSLRPALHSYVYPLPGDETVPIAQLVVVDVETKQVVPVQGLELPILHYGGPLRPNSVWWNADGSRIYVVSRGRGYQSYRLSEIDAATGQAHTLVEESAKTAIDTHPTNSGGPLVRILRDGSIIWFSQRDGWGHLYLYGTGGGEPRQMTSGPFLVTDILHVDEANQQLYISAMGREAGRDPYFNFAYRLGLDGGEPELLTPEDATHQLSFSPSGAFFVDSYSRVDQPPTTVLRASDGSRVLEMETADITGLTDLGWAPPERFCVKARDGVTDIYGVLILPTRFDPSAGQSLPILDSIYAGPQTNQAPTSFLGYSTTVNVANKTRDIWNAQAFAELGFAVVMIDGLGMPFRNKAFHDRSFRQLGDGGIEDHVVAIRQLAETHPYLDLSRVGIYGHSAGGYASTRAILMFPEFYKVAVSSAGNHDHRLDKATWVERYMGLPVGEHYHEQSNVTHAHRLAGKLLLMHGEMDENVHPASTLQVVDALIKANKDFDLLIVPNRPHGMGADPYFVRRRWDYFVRHLLGAEPPVGYAITGEAAAQA